MKNATNKIPYLLIASLVCISTALIGCGGSDGGSAKVSDGDRRGRNGGRVDPSRSNDGYDDLLVTGLSVSTDGAAEMAVEIFTPADEAIYANYAGPVDVFGYLDYQGPDFPECGFRQGYYEIRTVGPSGYFASDQMSIFNWQGTVLEGVRQGDNRDVVRIVIPQGNYQVQTGVEFVQSQTQIGLDGFSYNYEFWGEVIIESFDGYPCYVGFGAYSDYRRIYFAQPTFNY